MLAFFAVAAMGLTACQNDIEEKIEAKESVVVTFVADSAAESRTSVDTSGDVPVFAWGNNETFAVLEQTTSLASATNVEYAKDDEGKATITATFDHNAGQSEYKYVAVYPLSGYYESDSESIYAAKLYLSNNQTMYSDASYDPNADLMVSKVVTTAAQPTEAQYLQFTRLAAVAKMSIKGVEGTIEKVIFTANGKNIAGTINADLENIANEDGTHNFVVAEGSDTITIDGAVNNGAVYFTLMPTTLAAGDEYTVTIVTEDKIYVKKGTIPDGKSLQFAAGMVTRFGVNMEGVVAGDKWMLVRDVNELEAGDIVTFVSKNYNWVMGKWASSYPYASYTEVVKIGDYLYHPIAAASEANNRIQHLVVAPRAGKENAFEFYNQPNEYDGDSYSGYICTYSTNNNLKVQTTPSGRSLFYTTIEDGTATLEATDSDHTYKKLRYRAYSGGNTTSNRRFGCTSTITNEHDDICIYKIAGGVKGVVPTPEAQFTVPAENSPVVIGKEGATGAEFETVAFNYVGDWTISVSDNADWLTLNYADEKLSYTATANTGAVRNAVVTITASHDGEDDIVKTFKVVQKGEPQPISVEDFAKLGVDANAEYLVTGVITTSVKSNTSDTEISDGKGNTAKFRYVYTADNKSSFYNTDANALGNVVTILATKTNSGYGGSSSAHALCQGYYNLSATVETDHVAYSGGDVKVTIAKGGTLTPQTITGSVSELFAQLIYTENATEATVKLPTNEGAPREVVATFTDGLATTSVAIVQGADTTKGNTWELVTDAATLEAGDKVIIAAKDYDVAMSTTIASDRRSETAVTKIGNYYLVPSALDVQTFVLGAGSVDGTFAFYDATNKGFLVSSITSSSASVAKLENQPYVDENASFNVTIADGAATIKNVAGEFSGNYISYNTSKYFISSTSTGQALSLYRLVGVKGTIPVVAADVTANDAVISEDAAVSATPIPEVVFNYVGDWDITATTDAEWITSLAFDKANNCLTYTAEANLGAVRETTVTITATLAGQTDITWEFNLLQKGFIPKMTIAEYIAIPANDRSDNEYVRYELTGRIIEAEDIFQSLAVFTIDDESGDPIQVRGLVDESTNQNVAGNLNLKVGDVITITVPRLTDVETAGKSGKPAYYISHYNIEATATAAEYTAGSTATISIATTSGLDVTYEMGDCDFATISYTTDPTSENTTATVTFTSTNEAEAARSVDVTFKTGLASTTVTVTQKIDPAKVKGWVLVTDASELAIGDEVIIVAKNANYALGCFTSTHANNANSKKSEVVINGNSISSEEVNSKDVQKFTLVEGYSDGTVAFEFDLSGTTYYMYYTTGGLKMHTTKASNSRAWTIDVAADGEATITSKSSGKVVRFNYVSSSGGFSTYSTTANLATDAQAAICIYKNTEKE